MHAKLFRAGSSDMYVDKYTLKVNKWQMRTDSAKEITAEVVDTDD